MVAGYIYIVPAFHYSYNDFRLSINDVVIWLHDQVIIGHIEANGGLLSTVLLLLMVA